MTVTLLHEIMYEFSGIKSGHGKCESVTFNEFPLYSGMYTWMYNLCEKLIECAVLYFSMPAFKVTVFTYLSRLDQLINWHWCAKLACNWIQFTELGHTNHLPFWDHELCQVHMLYNSVSLSSFERWHCIFNVFFIPALSYCARMPVGIFI